MTTRTRSFPMALLAAATLVLCAGLSASAEEADTGLAGKTFHFGTSAQRTNISFVSEADLETIYGTGNKMQGTITVDETGRLAKGELRVGLRTLSTGIELRDEHMRQPQWLNAAEHPWITLEVTEAKAPMEGSSSRDWTYKAKLTIKGVTREVRGTARVVAIPRSLSAENLGEGDWVRVVAKFDVDISQHGVDVEGNGVVAKVSKVWNVKIDVYATTQAPASNG